MKSTQYYVVAFPDGTYYGVDYRYQRTSTPLYEATRWCRRPMAERTARAYNASVELWDIKPDSAQQIVPVPEYTARNCGLTPNMVWSILDKEFEPEELLHLISHFVGLLGVERLATKLSLPQCTQLVYKVYGFTPEEGLDVENILQMLMSRKALLERVLNFDIFPIDRRQTQSMDSATYNMVSCTAHDRPLSWVKMYLSSRTEKELFGAMCVDEVMELYYIVFHKLNTELNTRELFHAVCEAAREYESPKREPATISTLDTTRKDTMLRRFACHLLRLRKKSGESMEQVAGACAIEPDHLRLLEFGGVEPSLWDIWALAAHYKVTRDYLVN